MQTSCSCWVKVEGKHIYNLQLGDSANNPKAFCNSKEGREFARKSHEFLEKIGKQCDFKWETDESI